MNQVAHLARYVLAVLRPPARPRPGCCAASITYYGTPAQKRSAA